MKLCFCLLAFLAFAVSESAAQDFNNYQPARCNGPVPDDFKKLSSDKAREAIEVVNDKDLGRREKRDERNYAVSSNFLVDELLSSGQILFGDSMTDFVNRVADVLLAGEKELRSELRFYVYRSLIPNAYATHTGIVLVSVGLLARIENEAQLACILAHEIQHYVKKHALQQYKKAEQMKRGMGGISRVQMDELLKEMYRFSKESESEADLLGFRLMQKTSYNLHEGLAVFDMLRYTEYPFLEISYTYDSLESEHYRFPEEVKEDIEKLLAKKPLNDESDEEEADEENSTHPSLTKRIEKLRSILEEEGIPDSGKNFIISETTFNKIQHQARCELLLLYVRHGDFGKVIYLSRVMELVYGKTNFTDKTTAMGWYGLAFHKLKRDDIDDYGCNTRYAIGDWRPLLALFKSLNSRELSTLAMRELYKAAAEHPGDPWFSQRRDKVFMLAKTEDDFSLLSFANYTPVVVSDSAKVEVKPEEPVVKNPRNRRRNPSQSSEKLAYYYAAFYGVEHKDSLRKFINSLDLPDEAESDKKRELTKREKKKLAKNPPIVVKSLAMFEPSFSRYDISGKGEKKRLYFDEEIMTGKLKNKLEHMGELAEMPVSVISGSNQEAMTTEDLNRYMILNDWFIERMNNDTNSMLLWNTDYTAPLMSDMGTDYLGWVGFRYIIEKHRFHAGYLLGSIIVYPALPVYLIWQVSRKKEFSYAAIVFNTQTGALTYLQAEELPRRMKSDFMNAQLFQLMYHIKRGGGVK